MDTPEFAVTIRHDDDPPNIKPIMWHLQAPTIFHAFARAKAAMPDGFQIIDINRISLPA